LVDQINDSYSTGAVMKRGNESPQEILNSGKIYEEQRQYGKAVDRYL